MNQSSKMMAIAPMQMRRLYKVSTQATRTGHFGQFRYPHSHSGTNNAFNNMPQIEQPRKEDFQVGDHAPLAHTNLRQFPDWYKPYTFNYTSEGYLLLAFGVFTLFGYSYFNDIKEQKGRRHRQKYISELQTEAEKSRSIQLARNRIAAGDADYEKFAQRKERAHVHH